MRNECVMIGCFNSGINTNDFPIPIGPEKSARARTHARDAIIAMAMQVAMR